MAITRVNTVSLNSDSGTGSTITIPAGTGILAGDLLVVAAISNGTHASNGIAVQDSVNLTNFTTIKETQLGSSSPFWLQTFYYATPAAIADGATITLTPYSGFTRYAFAVDIFRGTTGTIGQAVTQSSNTAGTSQAAPALGSAPIPGDLVLTFDAAASGALTPGTAFTAGSSDSGTAPAAIGYLLPASGMSTYASTWTDTASAVSAAQTVSFGSAQINSAYLIASNAFASGTTPTTVTAGAAAGSQSSHVGDAIFVIATCGSASVAPSVPTDSHSQAYALVGSVAPGNGLCSYIYALYNSGSALVSGVDTVTVPWSSTSNRKSVMVVGADNVATSSALDEQNTAYGVGTGPSVVTPGSLSSAGELALAVVMGGQASSSTTFAPGWTQIGSTLQNGTGVYTTVAYQVPSSTTPVNASATLGASDIWSAQIGTFIPAAINPTNPAATITITTASPLPSGTVGVAYSDQLAATGGTPPYLWDNSSGSPPAGLSLSRGTTGGTSAIATAGFTFGATGSTGLTESDWATDYRKFLGNPPASNAGQGLFVKMFYHTALAATWAATSGTTAPAVDIANAFPGVLPMICWNNAPSASGSEITSFCNSIPSGQQCAFAWIQEMENDGIASGAFQSAWKIIYNAVRASKNSANLFMTPASAGFKYTSTSFGTGFLPPPNLVDAYCCDSYYHLGSPPTTGLQDYSTFQNWLTLAKKVNGGARPFGISEYGIDDFSLGNSASAQALRAKYLHNDITWINSQFNNPSGTSGSPLFCWLYWDRWTKGPSTGPEYGPLTDSTAISLWAGVIKSTGGGGSGSSGGLLSGIPTAAGTTSATYRVTDSNSNTGTKSLSITINAANTLAVATTSPLPGATTGVAYSTALQASGGTPPYTWTTTVGSPPNGIGLGSGGLLAGTPTVAGTSSATYQVTDSASLTASASLSMTVSSGLSITTTTLPGATIGVSYAATLVATGGTPPYNWSIISGTGLPDGLALDPVAGTITGTPTTGGTASFTMLLTDSANATVTQQLAISVAGSSGGGGGPGGGSGASVGRRKFGGGISDWTFTNGPLGPGGGGSGSGVSSVSAGDSSISVGGSAGTPTVETGTLDQIASLHPPAGDWSNNSHKITSLANGSGAQDAAAYGQTPAGGATVTIGQGGTGQTGQQAAINALTGSQSSGKYLRSDGANATLAVIQAADVPQLADYAPTGLTGATAASRYVGATASGHPASGTFAVGDYTVDQTGSMWVCTSAGTPGTWTQISGGSGFSNPMTTSGDIITGGSSGAAQRLAIGTSGQALIVSTGAPAWGTLPFGGGGTGQTTQQAALDAVAGAVTSGLVLRGNGTHVTLAAIQVADVPTLNQNTSGTAAGLSSTLAIGSGGTGQTSQQAALDAIAGAVTNNRVLAGNGTHVTLRALAAADLPAQLAPTVVTLTDASTILVDASLGNDFRLTLTASGHTLGNPSNSVDGQRIVFWVTQPGAGGPDTMSFGGNYEGASGLALPTLSTAASVTDLIAFIYNAGKTKWCLAGYVLGFA